MASGDTKTQQYLDVAANGTRADLPSDTCCETRTQTLIRGVAERIMDVEDEVERLENNPDVVDIVATYAALQAYPTSQLTDKDVVRVLQDETHDGDSTYYRWSTTTQTWTYIGESKQYTDFVGTDGTAGGQNGLVPAPVATDAGKFLNANGSWEEVQAGATYTAGDGINISAQDVISATNTGKAKVLTTADYNYPEDNPTMINTDTLPAGVYLTQGQIIYGNRYGNSHWDSNSIVVFQSKANFLELRYDGRTIRGIPTGDASLISSLNVVNNLTSTAVVAPLSARQGKVLNDKIGGDLSNLTTTDKTSLIAAINELNTRLGNIGTALQTLLNGTGA